MSRYNFDKADRRADVIREENNLFSFKLKEYNEQALSHCYAIIEATAHQDIPYGKVLSDMKFRNIHNSDVKVKNLKIERWESEDYEVTEREYEDYEHTITQEEWGEEEKMSGKDTEMMLGGKVGDTVTRKRVVKEWQETRTKWLWKERDTRGSKDLIPAKETVYIRVSFDKPFDFNNQKETSVDWIPVVEDELEIKELAWFNSNWERRKKITVKGETGSGTNYQIKLNVGESSGATGFDLHLEGNSASFPTGKNNGGDLRFTSDDGSTELSFWVQKIEGSSPNRIATVWVKVTDSLDTDQDIYIYYGNSSSPSNVSSGEDTFIFFDDHDGTTLNRDKWWYGADSTTEITTDSDFTVENSYFKLDLASSVYRYLMLREVASPGRALFMGGTRLPSTSLGYHHVGGRARYTGPDSPYFTYTSALLGGYTAYNNTGTRAYYRLGDGSSSVTTGQVSPNVVNSLADWEFLLHKSGRAVIEINQTEVFNQTGFNTDDFSLSGSCRIYNSGKGSDYWVDYAFIREFNDTEPSFSSVGSEETGTPTVTDTGFFSFM